MTLFSQVLSQINQSEMLREVVNLLLIVIQSVIGLNEACQKRALAHYNVLVTSLMAATAADRGQPSIIGKVSQCLVSIMAQADMLGQLEGMGSALQSSFDQCPMLQVLDPRVKLSFVYVVMVLREEQHKV